MPSSAVRRRSRSKTRRTELPARSSSRVSMRSLQPSPTPPDVGVKSHTSASRSSEARPGTGCPCSSTTSKTSLNQSTIERSIETHDQAIRAIPGPLYVPPCRVDARSHRRSDAIGATCADAKLRTLGVAEAGVDDEGDRAPLAERRARLHVRLKAALDPPGFQQDGEPATAPIPEFRRHLQEGARHHGTRLVEQVDVPRCRSFVHRRRERHRETQQVRRHTRDARVDRFDDSARLEVGFGNAHPRQFAPRLPFIPSARRPHTRSQARRRTAA